MKNICCEKCGSGEIIRVYKGYTFFCRICKKMVRPALFRKETEKEIKAKL